MEPKNLASRLRIIAEFVENIANELDPPLARARPVHKEAKPKKKTKPLPPCEIPGLADECWAAFLDQRINRVVALKLAELPDHNEQRKRLALTCEAAARRIAALQARVEASMG